MVVWWGGGLCEVGFRSIVWCGVVSDGVATGPLSGSAAAAVDVHVMYVYAHNSMTHSTAEAHQHGDDGP